MLKKSLILIGFSFSLLSSNHQVKADETCHPTINNSSQNFIIGYGSLIETRSRASTEPSANDAYPIKVKGFQRLWGINGGYYNLHSALQKSNTKPNVSLVEKLSTITQLT